ncbi:antibiotic biosynthesis monooxygenase family protein [Williamsia sp. MIQD14]|uniref:antibiotic biosynthesis monooxygenase family protein n=1 Tax=Williamsia sp. MIQD14 TaxID=3425703 RepID=UPI003D9FEB33
MIVEHALLPVAPGRGHEFRAAFAEAKAIVASMPGFVGLRLSRGIEDPDTYLLLIEWDQLTDHTEGFRDSPEYRRWRELLHHFYDPFPEVTHFDPVDAV